MVHMKRAQYCIKKRSDICTPSYTCSSCGKAYTSRQNLNIHTENCVKYQVDIEVKKYNDQLELFKALLSEKDAHIRELEGKLENIAICRSTTTNNTINTIIQKLDPITTEYIESTVPQLTIEHIKKGPKGYAEYALEHPLKNRVVCVDYSRRKIKYKDKDGNVVTDPEMNKLSQQLFQSINDRNKNLITQYMNKLLSQVEFPEEIMGDMAEYMTMVNRGASGEKTDLYHEFIKNVCSSSI